MCYHFGWADRIGEMSVWPERSAPGLCCIMSVCRSLIGQALLCHWSKIDSESIPPRIVPEMLQVPVLDLDKHILLSVFRSLIGQALLCHWSKTDCSRILKSPLVLCQKSIKSIIFHFYFRNSRTLEGYSRNPVLGASATVTPSMSQEDQEDVYDLTYTVSSFASSMSMDSDSASDSDEDSRKQVPPPGFTVRRGPKEICHLIFLKFDLNGILVL